MKNELGKGTITLVLAASIAGILAVAAVQLKNRVWPTFQQKSFESEIRAILSTLGACENAYFQEFQKFSSSPKEIGYSSDIPEIQIFFSKSQVPKSYLFALPEQALPFVTETSFRILLGAQNENRNRVEFWILDQSGKIKKLDQALVSD
jgi:hypothetical protein